MIKSFFIICCFSLLLVLTVFMAGGLDHSKSTIVEQNSFKSKTEIPLDFSKITGLEKPSCKPFQTYISKN